MAKCKNYDNIGRFNNKISQHIMEDSGIDSGDHTADGILNPTASDSSSTGSSRSPARLSAAVSRHMQRKLEARIEHTKRLNDGYNQTSGLISIQRLPIPNVKDHQPLVQWDTDDSEEDIANFFPLSRKESRVHQELTDTFSIEEMSISGDDDDEEDLHLVPPQTMYKNSLGCCSFNLCIIM